MHKAVQRHSGKCQCGTENNAFKFLAVSDNNVDLKHNPASSNRNTLVFSGNYLKRLFGFVCA